MVKKVVKELENFFFAYVVKLPMQICGLCVQRYKNMRRKKVFPSLHTSPFNPPLKVSFIVLFSVLQVLYLMSFGIELWWIIEVEGE